MAASDDVLRIAGAALGRPVDVLVELDRRPFRLAFLPGSYVTVTVRDRTTREVLEPTLDLDTDTAVDADALRRLDRAAAEQRRALTPDLRDLLLRHPDLRRIEVRATRADGSTDALVTDAPGVASLADAPDVVRIALATDPEILDSPGGPFPS